MSVHPFDQALFGSGGGSSNHSQPSGPTSHAAGGLAVFVAAAVTAVTAAAAAPALAVVAGVVGLAGAAAGGHNFLKQSGVVRDQKEMVKIQLETARENLAGLREQRSMKSQAHMHEFGRINPVTGEFRGGTRNAELGIKQENAILAREAHEVQNGTRNIVGKMSGGVVHDKNTRDNIDSHVRAETHSATMDGRGPDFAPSSRTTAFGSAFEGAVENRNLRTPKTAESIKAHIAANYKPSGNAAGPSTGPKMR